MLNAAIVGLGWWGRVLVESATDSTKIRFCRAVSLDLADAGPFCSQRGLDVTDRLEAVLDDASIDAIVLATPHSLHVEQIVQASQRGKSVFTEKPLALKLTDAIRAVESCESAGVVLGIGTDKRFLPAVRRLREVTRSGELGEVVHCEANYSNNNSSAGLYSAWRLLANESPCGGMSGPGLHALDALVSCVGGVESASSTARTVKDPPQPIDSVTAVLQFEAGATGVITTTRGVPELFRMSIVGTAGWAEVVGFDMFRMRTMTGLTEEVHSPDLATGFLLDQFADAVDGKAHFPVSRRSMLQTVAAFEAIVESARSGASVAVAHVPRRSKDSE